MLLTLSCPPKLGHDLETVRSIHSIDSNSKRHVWKQGVTTLEIRCTNCLVIRVEFRWKSWNSSGNPGIPVEILAFRWQSWHSVEIRWNSEEIRWHSEEFRWNSEGIPRESGGNPVRSSGNPRKSGGNPRNVFTNFYFHVRRTNGSTGMPSKIRS